MDNSRLSIRRRLMLVEKKIKQDVRYIRGDQYDGLFCENFRRIVENQMDFWGFGEVSIDTRFTTNRFAARVFIYSLELPINYEGEIHEDYVAFSSCTGDIIFQQIRDVAGR